MASALLGVLALAELENANLIGTAFGDHGSGHGSAFNRRGADLQFLAFANGEHFGQGDLVANLDVAEEFNLEQVAFGDTVLLAAGLDAYM